MASPSNPEVIGHAPIEKAPIDEIKEKLDASVDEKRPAANVIFEVQSTKNFQSWHFLHSTRRLFTKQGFLQACAVMVKFGKFMGPGTIISVAYIDPDNFQTAVSSGAEFQYKLLFMILVSNLIAIYLQASNSPIGKSAIEKPSC